MEDVKTTLKGLLRAFVYGIVVSVGLTGLLGVIGMIVVGGYLPAALIIARSGLFMVGALGILLVSGLILFKRKAEEKLHYRDHYQWNERFGKLTLGTVLGVICLVLLLTGIAVDYVAYL